MITKWWDDDDDRKKRKNRRQMCAYSIYWKVPLKIERESQESKLNFYAKLFVFVLKLYWWWRAWWWWWWWWQPPNSVEPKCHFNSYKHHPHINILDSCWWCWWWWWGWWCHMNWRWSSTMSACDFFHFNFFPYAELCVGVCVCVPKEEYEIRCLFV